MLFSKDMWCTINGNVLKEMAELRKLGVIEQYNVPNMEALSDSAIQKSLKNLLIKRKKN